jgi:TetR/AcrR family transcriptional regulator, repressor for neighboring sulfatase
MSIKKSLPLRAKVMPRRRLTAEGAKITILDAAEAILNAHGPQGLKLADIAKGAKVTNGNVLHHFGTIEGVQDALMTRLVDRLIAKVLKITQSPWTEDQRMTMAIREMFEAFEDKSTCRLAAWLVMSDRTKRLDEMRVAIGRVLEEITRARAGGPRAHLPQELITGFMTLCIMNALGAGLFGQELGRLLGIDDTATRDIALSALMTLAARDHQGPGAA